MRFMDNHAGGPDANRYAQRKIRWGDLVWAKGFGDWQGQFGVLATTDAERNVLLAGFADGGIDFGGGELVGAPQEVVLAKLDPSGTHAWSHRFAGTCRVVSDAARRGADTGVHAGRHAGDGEGANGGEFKGRWVTRASRQYLPSAAAARP